MGTQKLKEKNIKKVSGDIKITIQIVKLIIDGFRVLAWPIFISAVLFIYRGPVWEILSSLSSKLTEAEKVSFGSLSFEIQQQAREAGDPALAKQVGALSSAGIEELLQTPRDGYEILVSSGEGKDFKKYGLPDEIIMGALKELENKGFIKFKEPIDKFLNDLNKLPKDKSAGDFASGRVWFLSGSDKNTISQELIDKEGYELTDLGKKAADAIVRVVALQLGNKNSR